MASLCHVSTLASRRITLRDGRQMAYAEHGSLSGKPVFLFHGTPGSRLFRHPDESIALSLDARIITIDRPGFGLSDPRPYRTMLDWPDDVLDLANALGIDRFAVLGYSGGGPYAAACASKIPHRVTVAALVSSMAPLEAPAAVAGMSLPLQAMLNLARDSQTLSQLSWWLTSHLYSKSPERMFGLEDVHSTGSDKATLDWTPVAEMLRDDLREAFRCGPAAAAWEFALLTRPWGFELTDIEIPVRLWHGYEDKNTPVSMGKYLAGVLPDCQAEFVKGEGHDLFYRHWSDILSAIVSFQTSIEPASGTSWFVPDHIRSGEYTQTYPSR